MDRWEYRIVTAPRHEDLEAILNKLGDDGWEAVSIQFIPSHAQFPGRNPPYWQGSLKRRKA